MTSNIGDLQVQDDFIVTIGGTVIGVREDEFLLQDGTGEVWVDAYGMSPGAVNLIVGEQVTVLGDMDDLENFDALQITRANGSGVIGQPFPGSASLGSGNLVSNHPINVISSSSVNIGDLQIRDDFFVTIGGTVTSVREDEFLLQDAIGEVWVDAYEISPDAVNLAVGNRKRCG